MNEKKDTLTLIEQSFDLFKGTDQKAYATSLDASRATMPVKSQEFKRLVGGLVYGKTKQPLNKLRAEELLDTLEAKGIYDGKTLPVHNRMAHFDGSLFYHLNNKDGDVVQVTKDVLTLGKLATFPDLRFATKGLEQPKPEFGKGGLLSLKQTINYGTEENFRLIVAWMVYSIMDYEPKVHVVLEGEQGSAKTTASETLADIIDPHKPILLATPKTEQDLMLFAQARKALGFDNLSGMTTWLSDALCRLSTGAGSGTRTLYKQDDMVTYSSAVPCILNGIDEIAKRADLADRAIILNLPTITPDKRKNLEDVKQLYNQTKPAIIGDVLKAAQHVLKTKDTVKLTHKPRMASYAITGTALESFFGWEAGAFMEAYNENIHRHSAMKAENDPVLSAVIEMLKRKRRFEGTATKLLDELNGFNSGKDMRFNYAWPKTAQKLSERLNREATNLRNMGVAFGYNKTRTGSNITLVYEGDVTRDACDASFPNTVYDDYESF